MWYLLLLAAATASPASKVGSSVNRVKYGAQQTLTCSWFTNFENSRLSQCRGEHGFAFALGDEASIECREHSCDKLNAEARRLTHWKQSDAPSGEFMVTFVGRVAVERHRTRYLGDGTRTVLMEEVVAVRKAK